MRDFLLIFVVLISTVFCEYCGDHKVPFGMEVHKNGKINLLCARPNCHEKKYAECPERADTDTCSTSSSWVGGLTQNTDGKLKLQCCEYDLLPKYATVQYENLTIREGEYFEGEELSDDGRVTAFDLIGNIKQSRDSEGKYYYNLLVYRYHCGNIPDTPPLWYKSKQWPYFEQNV